MHSPSHAKSQCIPCTTCSESWKYRHYCSGMVAVAGVAALLFGSGMPDSGSMTCRRSMGTQVYIALNRQAALAAWLTCCRWQPGAHLRFPLVLGTPATFPSPRNRTQNSITLTRAAGCFIASRERFSAGSRLSAPSCSAHAVAATDRWCVSHKCVWHAATQQEYG